MYVCVWGRGRGGVYIRVRGAARGVACARMVAPRVCLRTPSCDPYGVSGLAWEEKTRTLTVSFTNEQVPGRYGVWDAAYAVFRLLRYGRVVDVERVRIREGRDIHFPTIYASRARRWEEAEHGTNVTVTWSKFERDRGGRVVLYVNTWNHAMSERPTPGLAYTDSYTTDG